MLGMLNLLKPPGMTSHDAVDQVRRVLNIRRVGHTGTLDPAATGVLLLLLGRATRLAPFLEHHYKTYRATAVFGIATDSQDATGIIRYRQPVNLRREDVDQVLKGFVGYVWQLPPMTSAVKVKGQRLHRLARAGCEVERARRQVHIEKMDLLGMETPEKAGYPRALIECRCSKGTYVRTLVSDCGDTLGCGAHLGFLLRTEVGGFSVQDAVTLEELQAASHPWELVLPAARAVGNLAPVKLPAGQVRRIQSGNPVFLDEMEPVAAPIEPGSWVRMETGVGSLVAVARAQEVKGRIQLQPRKVL